MTRGNFSEPRIRLFAIYPVMLAVRVKGNLKNTSQADNDLQPTACSGPTRTAGNSADTSGISNRTLLEILFR
jgi:hypothetical protein